MNWFALKYLKQADYCMFAHFTKVGRKWRFYKNIVLHAATYTDFLEIPWNEDREILGFIPFSTNMTSNLQDLCLFPWNISIFLKYPWYKLKYSSRYKSFSLELNTSRNIQVIFSKSNKIFFLAYIFQIFIEHPKIPIWIFIILKWTWRPLDLSNNILSHLIPHLNS